MERGGRRQKYFAAERRFRGRSRIQVPDINQPAFVLLAFYVRNHKKLNEF